MKPRIVAIETEYGIEDKNGTCPKNLVFPESVKTASSDQFLPNGGRAYVDCDHPEYASPECRDCLSAALYDIAGQRVIHRAFASSGYRMHRLNRDMEGSAFGSHENYSIRKGMMTSGRELVASSLTPFIATRQIFAGAGYYDCKSGAFQISQRADSTQVVASEDTQKKRPIVHFGKTNESYSATYDRLHLIAGESNMMHYPNTMKLATTCMVVDMMEDGWKSRIEIENPVTALKSISRGNWLVKRKGDGTMPAIEVQRYYLGMARDFYGNCPDEETKYYLDEWGRLLDALEDDPMSLCGKLEWVTKKRLLEEMKSPADRKNASIEWHNINPAQGVYHMLKEDGLVELYFSDDQIERASDFPPSDTRARIRGKFVHYVPEDRHVYMNWDHIDEFKMPDPFDTYEGEDDKVIAISRKLPSSKTPPGSGDRFHEWQQWARTE